MNRIFNNSPNLRQEDVIDLPDCISVIQPPSAKQVKLLNDRFRTGVPVAPVAATVVLTLATNPTDGDELYIGDETYTFMDEASADFDVAIGVDAATTQASLKTKIGSKSALVTCGTWSANAVTLTAKVKGTVGHSILVDVALTDEDDGFATATLAGGVDGTEAIAPTFMVDKTAHKLYVAEDDCTTAVSHWKSVDIS